MAGSSESGVGASRRLRGPWAVLAVAVVLAVLVVALGHVRLGGYLLAAGFAVTAALRAVLGRPAMGALAVRSRATDVVGLAAFATVTAVLTATLNLAP